MALPAAAPPASAAPPPQDDSDLLAGVPQDDSDLLAGIPQQGQQQQPSPWNQPQPMDVASASRRDWERVKGFVKSAARSGAGALDLANVSPIAGTTETVPAIRRLTDAVRARTQMSNPEQEQGDFVESALEFLPLMEEEAPGMAKSLVDKLGMGQDLAKFAAKYPKLAAAWNVMAAGAGTAARGGAEQAGQTYLKTGGDIPATVAAGETGALVGGTLGTGAAALGEGSKAIEGARAGRRTVAGGNFETNPRTGKLVLRNTQDVVQDPATQAVDEALGHIGKTAVANSMNRSNAARAPEIEIIPPSRRLPGGGGFTIPGPGEPTPTGEGQIAFEPGKQHTGTRAVAGKGPGGFRLSQYSPELYDAGTEAAAQEGTLGAPNPQPEPQGNHREPVYQYRNAPRPGTEGNVVTDTPMGGPGNLILGQGGSTGGATDIITADGEGMSVERARQQAAQYERILNDPDEVDQMGVRQHQQLIDAHADLTDQLNRYNNYAANQPHFPRFNPVEAERNTDSLADASEQLKAAHEPFWKAANEASNNEWTNLREREKWLRNKLNSKNPVGNWDDLNNELQQNQQQQMDFFDRYKTTVSPQEWETARSGYQDGIVLGNLDDFLQRKFNGITRAVEQRGIAAKNLDPSQNLRQRIFQPSQDFSQQLEDFYNSGFNKTTNRQVLERTIGQQHMDSLHDLGIMFNSTERMQQSQGLTKNILTSILHHYHGVRGMLAAGGGAAMLGATLGAREAGIAGVPLLTGTGAGINRYITDRLITDPSFLKTFSYAMKNAIPPRTAGPLLAARIISTWQNQPLKQQNAQPQGEP